MTKPRNQFPTILGQPEVQRLLCCLSPTYQLPARLLYGCGLRLMECVCLRAGNVDLERKLIQIWDHKQADHRLVSLPDNMSQQLHRQIELVQLYLEADRANPQILVSSLPQLSPDSIPCPSAPLNRQYLFPARSLTMDSDVKRLRRHHISESALQKAVKQAAKSAGINKNVSPQTLRHCYAVHMLMAGNDIRTLQKVLGHSDLQTTQVYSRFFQRSDNSLLSNVSG